MANETCICGDPTPNHDHAPKSLIPVVFLGLILGAGYVHAKRTGNCLCGDIVKKFTGKRPKGAQ